jgi:hypothetical protein
MRGLLYALRIALIVMLALPAAALAQAGMTVTPGLGIGTWTLDRKVADYNWIHGDVNLFNGEDVPLTDVRTSGTDTPFNILLDEKSWREPSRIFIVFPAMSDAVWAVGSTEGSAQTVEHVGVGSTQEQVTGAYQAPQFIQQLPLRSRTLIYDTRGVAFEFDYAPDAGKYSPSVGRVWVFRPGHSRAIWRLP